MTSPSEKSSSRLAGPVVGVSLLVVGVVAWLVFGGDRNAGDRASQAQGLGEAAEAGSSALPAAASFASADAAAQRKRVAAGGRLSVDLDEVRAAGSLRLALALSDAARGTGDRIVRVVSEDGRRLDTTATPIDGAEGGVQLELESDFFASRGRYLLEVETADEHPLRLRRYVLELD